MLPNLVHYWQSNRRELVVFLLTPVLLTANKYLSDSANLVAILRFFSWETGLEFVLQVFHHSADRKLYSVLYWAVIQDIFYFVVPCIVIVFYLKESLADYGLCVSMGTKERNVFLGGMLVMLPLVYLISLTAPFQQKYPFYSIYSREQLFPQFAAWELFYFSQFFALEFFFRGLMVKGLQKKFGSMSIFVMVIPYCMIHFGKPWPETLASIMAGIGLGYISYKGNSILVGFLMHITVAGCMDLLSLYHKGFF